MILIINLSTKFSTLQCFRSVEKTFRRVGENAETFFLYAETFLKNFEAFPFA